MTNQPEAKKRSEKPNQARPEEKKNNESLHSIRKKTSNVRGMFGCYCDSQSKRAGGIQRSS